MAASMSSSLSGPFRRRSLPSFCPFRSSHHLHSPKSLRFPPNPRSRSPIASLRIKAPQKTSNPSLDREEPSSTLHFVKYQGLGNDFILVDNTDSSAPEVSPEQAAELCDRNFGVGVDGVISAMPGVNVTHYSMRIFNSDGSEPEETVAFSLSADVSPMNALMFGLVMSFSLAHTVYATAIDPNRGNLGVIAPIAIGSIVGANILAGRAFDRASMNPAVSFGPAMVSSTWTNHWVYRMGPMTGAALAALVYDTSFFVGEGAHDQLPTEDDQEGILNLPFLSSFR